MRKLLHFALGGVCTAILACMVILTIVDIVGRYWFNSPLSGAFELTQLMLAAVIFSALPLTTYSGEHVEVDIFYHMASSRPKLAMRILGAVISSIALWIISWRLVVRAMKLAHDGAVTDALSIPLAPIAWLGAFATAVSGVLALLYLAQFSLADEMLEIGKSGND